MDLCVQGKNCCLNSSTVELFLKNEPQSTATKNMIHLAQSKSTWKTQTTFKKLHVFLSWPPRNSIPNFVSLPLESIKSLYTEENACDIDVRSPIRTYILLEVVQLLVDPTFIGWLGMCVSKELLFYKFILLPFFLRKFLNNQDQTRNWVWFDLFFFERLELTNISWKEHLQYIHCMTRYIVRVE